MRHDEAIAVSRIDPHVVVVADRRELAGEIDAGFAAIDRLREFGREKVRLILVVGLDGEARVVVRAAAQPAIGADELPILAAVVAAPERAALRRRAVERGQAVAGLDERVHAIRIAARDLHRDFSDRRVRQAVARQSLPRRAAVGRFEEAAARAAARSSPRVDLDLPHAGKQNPRIAHVDRDVGAARVLVDEERALPRLAAIGGAVHAAIGLRAVRVAEGAGEHDVGIARIDRDAADASRRIEPGVRPGLARIGRLVDAVADRDVAADERLARAGPHDVGIRRRDGDRSDRRHRLAVENRIPVRAVVDRLEDAARRRADVIDVRVGGNAGDGDDAIADGSDVAELQLRVRIGRDRRRARLRARHDRQQQQSGADEDEPSQGVHKYLRAFIGGRHRSTLTAAACFRSVERGHLP